MFDLSISDKSSCREISKFKISIHLNMSVKNDEGFIFVNNNRVRLILTPWSFLILSEFQIKKRRELFGDGVGIEGLAKSKHTIPVTHGHPFFYINPLA